MKRMIFCAALLAAGQAQAFCDEGVLQTDVLCLTEEVEEIKVCRTVHPETGAEMLALHVDPAISDGPIFEVARDIPFFMQPGTGGYPWDTYGMSFLHEGGRAMLTMRRAIDATNNDDVEFALSLFDRGAEPYRTMTCLVPALRAELEGLFAARGVELNTFRTGPSAESLPFYAPRKPLPGDAPYGGYSCREVGIVISNEGTDGEQVALYTAPNDEAAIMGYAYPYEVSGAFECWAENGYSAIVWPDAEKRGDGDPWSMLDFDARMATCGLDEANWPPNTPYFGKCSTAWIKAGNVAGMGG